MSMQVRENRVRRMAFRQGLLLVKSRMRDPQGTDYGKYGLVMQGVSPELSTGYVSTLEDIERSLDWDPATETPLRQRMIAEADAR